MKNFLKTAWVLFCILLSILFLISCFSLYIPPASFSYIALFAIAFPYLFILMLIAAVTSFYIKKKTGFIMLVCLLPGSVNLLHTVAFNLPQKAGDKQNDSVLRIMTWNVQDFVNLTKKSDVRAKMLHIIAQKKPDILCLQEFTDIEGSKRKVSVRKELDSLGYAYCFFSNDQVIVKKNDAVT